jgi:F-type H+-transporting ATPase subunit b
VGNKLKYKLEIDGKAQYNNMLEKAKAQIETEKKKALGEIKTTVIEIAIKASEKVIKRNLNDEDNKKMIEQTVEEFKQQN